MGESFSKIPNDKEIRHSIGEGVAEYMDRGHKPSSSHESPEDRNPLNIEWTNEQAKDLEKLDDYEREERKQVNEEIEQGFYDIKEKRYFEEQGRDPEREGYKGKYAKLVGEYRYWKQHGDDAAARDTIKYLKEHEHKEINSSEEELQKLYTSIVALAPEIGKNESDILSDLELDWFNLYGVDVVDTNIGDQNRDFSHSHYQEVDSEKPISGYRILVDREQRLEIALRTHRLVIETKKENCRNLVFLDKSARPLATLFIDLWHKQYPELELPHINFLNAGTELSFVSDYTRLSPDYSNREIPDSEIERLRKEYGCLAHVQANEPVIIIDDQTVSRRSAKIASEIIIDAFPQIRILKCHIGGNGLFGLNEDAAHGMMPPWMRLEENNAKNIKGINGVVDKDTQLPEYEQDKYEWGHWQFDEESDIHLTTEPTRKRVLTDAETDGKDKVYQKGYELFQVLRQEMHQAADEYWSLPRE